MLGSNQLIYLLSRGYSVYGPFYHSNSEIFFLQISGRLNAGAEILGRPKKQSPLLQCFLIGSEGP